MSLLVVFFEGEGREEEKEEMRIYAEGRIRESVYALNPATITKGRLFEAGFRKYKEKEFYANYLFCLHYVFVARCGHLCTILAQTVGSECCVCKRWEAGILACSVCLAKKKLI